jgi:hypothetical protein
MQILKNKIVFDESDWLAGLHPAFSASGSDTPVPTGNSRFLTQATSFNPYRAFGYASPGFNPTDVTNVTVVTNSAMRNIVLGAESTSYYGYGINSNTKLFQMDATTGALTSSGTWPHTITPAATSAAGQDVCLYSAKIGGTRATRLFYSYNNTDTAVKADIGAYSLDGATFDDDFMSTAPDFSGGALGTALSSLQPHPMIVGDDDLLYFGNGNQLYGYDGNGADNDGNIYLSLTLPANFRITSFAKFQQKLVIFGYSELASAQSANPSLFYATHSTAYFWDYLSQDPYDSKELNDNFCSSAFSYKGTVGCFTGGRKPVPGSNQVSSLRLFDGNIFAPVAQFEKNPPFHGAVDIVGDTIMWNSQGTIYQWGSPYAGFPDGLNKSSAGSGTDSGAIRTLSTTMQVISTGTSTSGGLQKITTSFSTGSVATALASPVWSEEKEGKVKSVKVEYAATASGGRSIDVILWGNNLAATTILSTVSTVTSSNIVTKVIDDSSGNELPKFEDLGLILQWQSGSGAGDAPRVKRVTVEFEEVNITGT